MKPAACLLACFTIASCNNADRARDEPTAKRIAELEDSLRQLQTRLEQSPAAQPERLQQITPGAPFDSTNVRYIGQGGAVFRTAQLVEDTYKLGMAGALTSLPARECDADEGDRVVILGSVKTDERRFDHLLIHRIRVVSGRFVGCTGYVLPGQLGKAREADRP